MEVEYRTILDQINTQEKMDHENLITMMTRLVKLTPYLWT